MAGEAASHDSTTVRQRVADTFDGLGLGRSAAERSEAEIGTLDVVATNAPVIRPETPSDYLAIRQVVAAAFGRSAEADLVERIRQSSGYIPELSLVAEIGGIIVGHVMISSASLRHESGERSIAMLSPLAVDPTVQRCGIGSALVEAAAALADQAGEAFVVLEGSPSYYRRLGFEPASRYGMTLPLPDWAPSEAARVLPLTGFDPRDPTITGTVIYPPAFDDLE